MIRIRDITPKGFYARSVLIVILPLSLLLMAMTWFFYDSHISDVSRKMSRSVANKSAFIVEEIERADSQDERLRITEDLARRLTLGVELHENEDLPTSVKRPILSSGRDQILSLELLYAFGDTPHWFDSNARDSKVDIRVAPDNANYIVRILADRKNTYATSGVMFISWVFVFSGFLMFIAWGFLRNQVRSVLNLTDAADAWGRGEEGVVLKPSGATEVRQAARAITVMRERIIAHAEQRTAMLAGVSHDLRTPLTRLKLQLALLPDSNDKAEAKKDIEDMEAMLNAYLAFARGEDGEKHEDTDLLELIRKIVDPLRPDYDIVISALHSNIARIRPLTVKRAISNIIENATHFATKLEITIKRSGTSFDIVIEDNGPGISPEQYENAFKPFSRLDESRNQNQSGVGLGLALARDVARSHGGDIVLSRSALGGLKVIFSVPA